MSATAMTVEYFLDYIEKSKSKNTYREYKYGITKFCKWFGKTPNVVLELRKQDWISGDMLQKKRFSREIEKFHKWLIDEGYSINTARTYCLGILQLFRFYEMPVTIPTGSDVSKTVITTKDYVPTPQQYREMYRVAGDLRSKLIISMGKDLGWRIGDFARIRKDLLPNLEQDAPIPFDLITEKENVTARSFLSQETVDWLKRYLPTVKDNPNPYLFPSNRQGHFDTESINRILKDLARKAKIKIPKRKRLRFHAFRKRFLSECANLSVDVNIAKILVGKSVNKSMLTYLSEIEHRQAFIKVHERLRLTKTPMRKTREPETELAKEVDRLRRLINIIGAMNPEMVKKAEQTLKDLGIVTMKKKSFIEMLDMIAKEQERKQQEEYAKIITENNNNNND